MRADSPYYPDRRVLVAAWEHDHCRYRRFNSFRNAVVAALCRRRILEEDIRFLRRVIRAVRDSSQHDRVRAEREALVDAARARFTAACRLLEHAQCEMSDAAFTLETQERLLAQHQLRPAESRAA